MMRILVAAMASAAAWAADLPVRQVVLFKHGVGYFERAGKLGPGDSARLDFKASEMDDVLKSLTIEEKGGGAVKGLRYDSSEPVAQKLAEFPFRLGDAQPLAAVLDQLKGARVEMKFGGETVTGAVVGGRVTAGDEKRPEREQVSLLLDGGELSTYDLATARSIRFTDPQLQTQFKDYLAALVGGRSKDKRSVYIDSTDARAREIVAGYMTPMPVWKSSYRLIFGGAAATLEGWAIVDNVTGEDWTNVQLALVSGRPISFVSRLYEPRYVARQTAELPEDRAYAPVVHEGAAEVRKEAGMGGAIGGIIGGVPMAAPPAPRQFDAGRLMAPRRIPSSIAAPAAAREMGDLFEYRIATPVTVHKSESVMLPFLQQKAPARKLLIYTDGAHPMNAAEITNDSGKTLDGGPVTVYDGGGYGGEALVETLKNGEKRLISYAIDLGTRITTNIDSKSDTVREVHVRRGVLTTRTAALETRTYTIRNVDQKAKTLIIEHPARPEYTLLDRKPSERTSSAYRFELKLAAGASEKFPVAEERIYENGLALTNLTPDVLYSYVQNRKLSDAARKGLEEIAARKQQIAGADSEIRQAEAQTADISRDQERIRHNIDSLNNVSGQQQQVQGYARQLAAQESQLATLRDQAAAQRKRKAALEAELAKLIDALEF